MNVLDFLLLYAIILVSMPHQRTISCIEPEEPLSRPVATTKKNVVAYCRVSTESDEQLNSFTMQQRHYKERIKNHLDWNYAGIYTDRNSGLRAAARPGFLAMMDDARKHRFDLILCKSPSRFSRNTVEALTALRELKQLGVDIMFDECSCPLNDPKAELFYSLYFSVAQEDSRARSENIRWGFRRAMESGRSRLYNHPCYGYRRDAAGQLVIYEPEAAVVRQIYAWHQAGKGSTAIAKLLYERGIKSPQGKDHWSPTTILGILSNSKYHGEIILQKTVTDDYLTGKSKPNDGIAPKYRVVKPELKIVPD